MKDVCTTSSQKAIFLREAASAYTALTAARDTARSVARDHLTVVAHVQVGLYRAGHKEYRVILDTEETDALMCLYVFERANDFRKEVCSVFDSVWQGMRDSSQDMTFPGSISIRYVRESPQKQSQPLICIVS